MGDSGLVIVTGSSGLIGVPLCERLAERYEVVGLDRAGLPPPDARAHGIEVDLASDVSVIEALARVRREHGARVASVVHLAAYCAFSGEPSPLYDEITVAGTQRLLRALDGFAVEQLVFTSTMLVHAPTVPGRPMDEDWPLEPKWDYPRSKMRAEELVRAGRGTASAVVLRLAGVYDDDCHSIPLAHQIQRISQRSMTSRVFPGDLTHGQAVVHKEDLLDALVRTVDRRAVLPEETTLLIGEPDTGSYDLLQRAISRTLNQHEIDTREMPKALAKAGAWLQDHLVSDPFIKPWMIDLADDHYELDIGRARRLLGWEPRRRLLAEIPRLIEVMQSDPEAWYRENGLSGRPREEPVSSPA